LEPVPEESREFREIVVIPLNISYSGSSAKTRTHDTARTVLIAKTGVNARRELYYVPYYPSSLLTIVSLLISCGSLFADEQTRKAQVELRKRHLFYGEITGQPTPALTVAIEHYQKKKGFARTGRLDFETCGSLGISCPGFQVTSIPVVLANNGEVRGANGETLSLALPEDRSTQFDRILTDRDRLVLTLLGSDYESAPRQGSESTVHSRVRRHRVAPPKEKNPFVLALWSMDHAMKRWMGDASPTKKKNAATKSL
jgi:hypothetical protein